MGDDRRQLLGQRGEDVAASALTSRGYAILARRYRTRCGEIDIIARQGQTIVFVEVKTRMGDRFGGGAAAVTWRKQRRMAQVASEYLARHGAVGLPCRFDVVVVTPGDVPDVQVFTHAFSVS